nr:MAG TPA: hypothetical protein [Caudoviricetes sp.]
MNCAIRSPRFGYTISHGFRFFKKNFRNLLTFEVESDNMTAGGERNAVL